MRGDRTPGQGLWSCQTRGDAWQLELQTKVREDFTITHTEKTFTFKTLLRHYAKRVPKHGK